MIVIVLVNSKGGVGKTTTAINLSESYRLAGYKVLLVDCDPNQGSATRWRLEAERNENEAVSVVKAESGLARLITDVRSAYEVVVVDGPANLDNANSALIAVADLVLIPIQSSQLDLWACESVIRWIEERQDLTGGLPEARFILSRSHPNQKVDATEMAKLSLTGIPIMHSRLVNRVSYARTLRTGGSVYSLPKADKARQDIEQVFKEIQDVSSSLPTR